jgi:hypothetical protein
LVYLVYLADADRDTATFAVFTYPVHQVDDRQEDRAPSLVSLKTTNVAMCALGKPCPVIATREQLDRWLAGRSGWAAIRPEAALLVPHWLGEAVEYACTRFRLGSVDVDCGIRGSRHAWWMRRPRLSHSTCPGRRRTTRGSRGSNRSQATWWRPSDRCHEEDHARMVVNWIDAKRAR